MFRVLSRVYSVVTFALFKSFQTGFFIAHLCHNPDLCDRSDPCPEIK